MLNFAIALAVFLGVYFLLKRKYGKQAILYAGIAGIASVILMPIVFDQLSSSFATEATALAGTVKTPGFSY